MKRAYSNVEKTVFWSILLLKKKQENVFEAK